MLIVRCSELTGRTRYEDIAEKIYGPKWARVTSYFNLICLMGFTTAYIVYVKGAIPTILSLLFNKEDCGFVCKEAAGITATGVFWGGLFSYLILLPMSIPRSVAALRFTSLFGVLCSMYLTIAVIVVFFTNKKLVPSPSDNFSKMEPAKITFQSVL